MGMGQGKGKKERGKGKDGWECCKEVWWRNNQRLVGSVDENDLYRYPVKSCRSWACVKEAQCFGHDNASVRSSKS